MDAQLLDRIKSCDNLPSLPTIAVQVLELAQKETVDIQEIARTISKDPALSAKILKTVNSSFYGRSQQVSSISQALVIMGLQSVKTLVLGFSLVSSLFKNKKNVGRFDHVKYWRHSIYHATAAKLVARKLGVPQQEEAFLIGLLADLGMLVMDTVIGDPYGQTLVNAASHDDVARIEQQVYSMTHAQISGVMLQSWKLPALLVTPVAQHHNADTVTEPLLKTLTQIAAFASRCADVFIDANAADGIAEVRAAGKKLFNCEVEAVDALLADVGTKTHEIASLFEIKLGENDSFECVLRRANQTLVQLMLQAQQKQATLREQNAALKQQVITDLLTGLTNRAGFDGQSELIWAEADLKQQAFSLVMIDIDRFKTINDTYGHGGGDEVLREVGKLLKSSVRGQDIACRYGGEEFVLVLPDTTRDIAAIIADRIRCALETRTITCEGINIPVTASFGVSAYEPGGPLRTLQHVIKAADLALYESKNTGRNRVKVFNPVGQPKAA
ncbi:MAG: sensor domain-containing diguanylate cyclase [Tepidisphaeraceae bacterium]